MTGSSYDAITDKIYVFETVEKLKDQLHEKFNRQTTITTKCSEKDGYCKIFFSSKL